MLEVDPVSPYEVAVSALRCIATLHDDRCFVGSGEDVCSERPFYRAASDYPGGVSDEWVDGGCQAGIARLALDRMGEPR